MIGDFNEYPSYIYIKFSIIFSLFHFSKFFDFYINIFYFIISGLIFLIYFYFSSPAPNIAHYILATYNSNIK